MSRFITLAVARRAKKKWRHSIAAAGKKEPECDGDNQTLSRDALLRECEAAVMRIASTEQVTKETEVRVDRFSSLGCLSVK